MLMTNACCLSSPFAFRASCVPLPQRQDVFETLLQRTQALTRLGSLASSDQPLRVLKLRLLERMLRRKICWDYSVDCQHSPRPLRWQPPKVPLRNGQDRFVCPTEVVNELLVIIIHTVRVLQPIARHVSLIRCDLKPRTRIPYPASSGR